MTPVLQSPSFEFLWESQQGSFRLQSPGRALRGVVGVEVLQRGRSHTLTTDILPPGRVSQESVTDAHGAAVQAHIHFQELLGLTLSFRLRLYPSRPFALAKISVTNVGPDPVHVRRFFISTLPGGFQSTDSPLGGYINGWQSWSMSGFVPAHQRAFSPCLFARWLQGPMIHNGTSTWKCRPGRFWSEMVGAVVTAREALIAGGASLADQFVQVMTDVRPAHEALIIQSQVDDVLLDVGGALCSEWFYLEWIPLPNSDPFAQYAYTVARQMEVPAPRKARTGWCSWYFYGSKVSEADVMENLASAALFADEVPLQVIQLDEGYQETWGDWAERNARFPHDFEWLGQRIRGSGFVPGLWLAPLTAHPKSRLAVAHPEWLLRNLRGRPVTSGLISGFLGRALDVTHPGVQDYVRELVHQAVAQWGYRYLKLDFMYAGALPGRRHNPRLTRAQALRQVFQIIRDEAGEETYVVGCGAPLQSAIGLVDAMRIGPDTASTWEPNYVRIGRLLKRNPSLPSLRNSMRNVTTRAWMHNRWWVNDPDTLLMRETLTQLTEDEVLAQATLVGLSGGAILLSDDLDALSPARRAIAAALLPPLLEGMDVLDLFQRGMPEEMVVPVATPWNRWQLVGLFNWGNTPVERTLPSHLSLDIHKAYHVVDFWERRYVRMEPGAPQLVFHLPPHGAILLGIHRVLPGPHLVATTYHISQGAEIADWHVEAAQLTIKIAPERLAHGAVWLALPARPKDMTLNGKPLPQQALRALAPGVWAVTTPINRRGTLQMSWSPQ